MISCSRSMGAEGALEQSRATVIAGGCRIEAQPIGARHDPLLGPRFSIMVFELDEADKFRAGLLLDPARCHVRCDVADKEALNAERAEGKRVHGFNGLAHVAD